MSVNVWQLQSGPRTSCMRGINWDYRCTNADGGSGSERAKASFLVEGSRGNCLECGEINICEFWGENMFAVDEEEEASHLSNSSPKFLDPPCGKASWCWSPESLDLSCVIFWWDLSYLGGCALSPPGVNCREAFCGGKSMLCCSSWMRDTVVFPV